MTDTTTPTRTAQISTDSTPEQVAAAAAAAAGAARAFGDPDASDLRIAALQAVASSLEEAGSELVALAQEESALAEGRLTGELARTVYQLRLFADCLAEGSLLEATVDTADPDWLLGPKPDLRRLLVPIGPVAVYAASNFPFAFSVAGGDTASALAAGCPVVLKAHPGHPRLSVRTAELVVEALTAAGAPAGTFGLVSGLDAGSALITEPAIKAGSFTGSIAGGRALFDLASGRPDPIPFYGELGSINPAFVTRRAAAARAQQIADGFVGSFTMGAGQFCTKPGVLFVPSDSHLAELIAAGAREVGPAPMLNDRILDGYRSNVSGLANQGAIHTLVEGTVDGDRLGPTVLGTDLTSLLESADALLHECFGPTALVVTYDDQQDLLDAARAFEGNLTATIQGEDADATELTDLTYELAQRAGRVLWNGWPTGVAVTWAMQHGGPWPATTGSVHTSVGPTAMRRFMRPLSFQDMPDALLPSILRRTDPTSSVRRVNGALELR